MAGGVYAGAHGLTACMGLILIALFLGFGAPVALLAAGGSAVLAEMGFNYVLIGVLDGGVAGSAYGIITRLLTFAFLPLLGLAYAMQTITGNNFGAGSYQRSDASL
uniref:Multi antimicrobial extrusion protein MatE n=2 Tax=Hyphomicrobiales TaxID=356 RepID=A0A0P0YZB9_9HYPH|nr:multi antimicrobial extrusion protein MatE [Aurantimonas coralicida]